MGVNIVIGLLFGDEAKGATVDYLVARDSASLVVRYNGGAQAAHNVVTPDGMHHTFSMFGSGTFSQAYTHLSRFVRVDVKALLNEAHSLSQKGVRNPLGLISVDENCVIVTPFHIAYSEYMAGVHNRGTCGMGVGAAARYAERFPALALYAKDLYNTGVMREKLSRMANYYSESMSDKTVIDNIRSHTPSLIDTYITFTTRVRITTERDWQDLLKGHENIVFEGAQGVLLDNKYGFHPYVTSSDTTLTQAKRLLEGYKGKVRTTGAIRSYVTRHGPGPLPTESSVIAEAMTEQHNQTGRYQGAMRSGWFDFHLIRKSLDIIGGIDAIALSHLDCMKTIRDWPVASVRRVDTIPYDVSHVTNEYQLVDSIYNTFGIPVSILGHGPGRHQRSALK